MSLEYFQENNFEVFIARDGQEANILKLQLPDIIILDVMMPMVDGFATLEQIKQDKRLQHCKVIFLSAKNKEKISKRIRGANLYVVKPFSVKKLVEQVQDLIQ
jgi:DNA-binding response OmpR family regulator